MEITIKNEMAKVPISVFRLKGDFTEEEALMAEARNQYEQGMRYALLDLSKVKYISSSGLRAIHGMFALLRGSGPEESDEAIRKGITRGTYTSPYLKLYKPSKKAQKTLSISGYDMFLETHKKYKEAINSFG
ncbi:MAG: STAS domain-containing protein [Candidatus Promineifilaceae bacterium]|jgi:anti-anti-sigma regulatory factor